MTEIKFYKKKGTEVRVAAYVDEAGNKTKIAMLGQVEELLELGVLEPVPGMNERAYVIIDIPAAHEEASQTGNVIEMELVEYDTMKEAADYVRKHYAKA